MKVVLVVLVLLVVLLLVIVVLEILVPIVTSTSIGRNTITGLHKEWVLTF